MVNFFFSPPVSVSLPLTGGIRSSPRLRDDDALAPNTQHGDAGAERRPCRHADIASAPRPRLSCRVRRFSSSSPHLPASTPLLSSSPHPFSGLRQLVHGSGSRNFVASISVCLVLMLVVSQSVSQSSKSVSRVQSTPSPLSPLPRSLRLFF